MVEEKWIPVKPPEGSTRGIIIPVGPFHPALIEPVYFRIKVDGERIIDSEIKVGFCHRGIQRIMEKRSYWRDIFLAERVCGICSASHNTVYCNTVELLSGVEAPERAKFIRTLVCELERIHSHLLWAGVGMDLIGFETLFMLLWRDRENVMDVLEAISGNRVTKGMVTIGGVRRDIAKDMIPKIEQKCDILEKATRKAVEAVVGDSIIKARVKGIGILTRDDAKRIGVVGPTARASGINIDVRRDDPYDAYSQVSFDVITRNDGDLFAKVEVRLLELLQSISICKQCLDKLKTVGGPIIAEEIPDFEAGAEAFGKIEAPRGELVYYILSNGTNIPERVRIRTPSYMNNPSLPVQLKDETIADAPIIIAGIDPCYSCTDRSVIVTETNSGKSWKYTVSELARKYMKKRRISGK
jgi:NADH-quinone oxidoreductase subunit D